MQYLKDEVRKNIEREGLEEFRKLGYKAASIRSIAEKANTSVGNFYKYFKSKEDLFENLIGPVHDRLMGYIRQFDEVELNEKALQIFYELMDKTLEIFNENSAELSILFNKSSDSKYGNCKVSFVDFVNKIVTEIMKYELSVKGRRLKDNFIICIVSHSFVEGIGMILDKRTNGAEVRQHVLSLINIFYMDMVDKLCSEEV
jgi:AcrR family transcriptional regulator